MKPNQGKQQAFQFLKPKRLQSCSLIEQLKKIDFGAVYEIDPHYLEGLETENPVSGAYRDLRQYLPMLAEE